MGMFALSKTLFFGEKTPRGLKHTLSETPMVFDHMWCAENPGVNPRGKIIEISWGFANLTKEFQI
jgi:hypothetical protein